MTKKRSLSIFTFFIFALLGNPAFSSSSLNEVNGLLLDRTVTLSGHAFYKKFSAHWLAANLTQPYNLVIEEKPSARWGNLIIISSQNHVLYRTSLRPGKQLKQNMIKKAATNVSQNIFNRLFNNNSSQDMAPTGY